MNRDVIATYPKPSKHKDRSHMPYRVVYDLAYDGGGCQWVQYYRTRLGARICIWFNMHLFSWGGTAVLSGPT